jgi:acetyl esterase
MQKTFTVTVEEPENGSIIISPKIPADGKVPAGTVVTISASPDDGYELDSTFYYYDSHSMFLRLNIESMKPVFKVTIDRDKGIGASFISKEALDGFTVMHDIVYAQPGVKKLKYDVFSPDGAKSLPCIVIIHGGGWSINTQYIMRGMARELAKSGDYVVFSIDYRWIGTLDGDMKQNSVVDIIEDVFAALAHIYQHCKEYGGDQTRMAVTGDSAGGHLSACAINMVDMLGDGGFGDDAGVYQFKPSYMPHGKSIEQVRRELTEAIRAAAPSYGVFNLNGEQFKVFAQNLSETELKAISPFYHIPDVKVRKVPQFLLRGTEDTLITEKIVRSYADALKAAGQRAEYVLVEGAEHAFLDWKPNTQTKAVFKKYGVPYIAAMKAFFDSVFYPGK